MINLKLILIHVFPELATDYDNEMKQRKLLVIETGQKKFKLYSCTILQSQK